MASGTVTSQDIKTTVAAYLRYKRQCQLVSFERGLYWGCIPDVLAVTDDMRLLEVEVKVSLSDFKRDAKKRKWLPKYLTQQVEKTFYYAVPTDLVGKVKPYLNTGIGLLSVSHDEVTVEVKAKRSTERIPMKMFMMMVRNQSATLIGLARGLVFAQRELGKYLKAQ